jgi:hypothetical protein
MRRKELLTTERGARTVSASALPQKFEKNCWRWSVPYRGSVGSDLSLLVSKKIVCARPTRRYRVTVLTSSKSES